MVEIRLRNTRTRKVEPFTPLDPSNVRMYLCGPTVYDRAHLGNARNVIMFDVLFRLMRHVFGADHVTYVRNFTDVDDKINARAAETGRPISEITEETIGWYLEDMGALGVLEPTHMPRATRYIPEMIAMIETLVAEGHAYEAEGHVLFSVDSWREGYGQLSGRSVDDMIAGARVEVAPYKRDPMDFVLWKPSSDDLPGWDSPWGSGRPGWHIECSAMAKALLGDVFDIHGGGNDLMFPHHENEIAQSCCANHTERMAQVWMHNEMLQVEGKKMSKSLGNFFTVRDLLDQGIPGEVIRFVFLSTHYSKPMDWTAKKAEEAEKTLRKWAAIVGAWSKESVDQEVISALADDLNTKAALDRLQELYDEDRRDELSAALSLLGIDPVQLSKDKRYREITLDSPDGKVVVDGHEFAPSVSVISWGELPDAVREVSFQIVRKWMALRRLREWEAADKLKALAVESGLELRATKSDAGNEVGIGTVRRRFGAGSDVARLKAIL